MTVTLECRLPADPASVPAARSFVTQALVGQPSEVLFRAELLVSELATNCVLHAATAFTVSLTVAGRAVRVDVSDEGGGRPAVVTPAASDPHGRGLRLVDQLATSWGIATSPRRPGKTLWFALLTSGVRGNGARQSG